MPALSKNLSMLLRKSRITQTRLAEIAGTPPTTLTRWVNGGTLKNYQILLKIAEHFQVDFQWLITGKHSGDSPQNCSEEIRDIIERQRKKY